MRKYTVDDELVRTILRELESGPTFRHKSGSGRALENFIEEQLNWSALAYESQSLLPNPFDIERPKRIDFLVFRPCTRPGKIVLEAKSQEMEGTTGEKLGTTARRLSAQVEAGYISHAYIVLNGHGWDPEHIAAAAGFPNVSLITTTGLASRLRDDTL